MRVVMILLVATAASASASPATLSGTVATTRSSWSGDAIITTSELRDAHGDITTVVQLGGVVDGIGMSFSHQPALLRTGDEVTLEVSRTPGVTALTVVAVEPYAALA